MATTSRDGRVFFWDLATARPHERVIEGALDPNADIYLQIPFASLDDFPPLMNILKQPRHFLFVNIFLKYRFIFQYHFPMISKHILH